MKMFVRISAVIGLAAALGAMASLWLQSSPNAPKPPKLLSGEPIETALEISVDSNRVPIPQSAAASNSGVETAEASVPKASKSDRFARVRERFRVLALGDHKTTLVTARQLTDDNEREAALLALLTEWTDGELSPPRQRAWAVATYGLEAGLGLELAKKPELAQLWSSELTGGESAAVSPEFLAPAMVDADPAMALAFADQLSADNRRKFFEAAFRAWAAKDTDAALQWANQLSDAAERESAINTIRSVAPVGIGTELGMKDGYPVVNRLFPGSPAELNGQIHPGDRIVAVAQSDLAFIDARSLGMTDLVQKIRGAPGTLVHLQVLPAEAPADSPPKTVTIVRGQIKLKR